MSAGEFYKTIKLGVEFETKDAISKFRKEYADALTDKNFAAQLKSITKLAIASGLTSALDAFTDKFSKVIDKSVERMDSMLSYSQMTDESVRELKLGYGFSSSQAYGYDTAMSVMGFSNMEDLMYANEQQLEQFRDAFNKYSTKYEELYDAGYFEQLQEYQVEMKEFEIEMQHEVVEFFMNNKDFITTGMKALITMSDVVISSLSWIVDFFSDGSRTSSDRSRETQSILNSYASSTSSTNVNISNEFNNVAKNDVTWLSNAGQMTYKQVIDALR